MESLCIVCVCSCNDVFKAKVAFAKIKYDANHFSVEETDIAKALRPRLHGQCLFYTSIFFCDKPTLEKKKCPWKLGLNPKGILIF